MITGHYDPTVDIASFRTGGWIGSAVVSEETSFGLVDRISDQVVGLEYWRATTMIPSDLLELLPPPPA